MAAGFTAFRPKTLPWFLRGCFCSSCSRNIYKKHIHCTSNNFQKIQDDSHLQQNSNIETDPVVKVVGVQSQSNVDYEDENKFKSKNEDFYGYEDGQRQKDAKGLFYQNMINLPKDLKQSLSKFYKKYPAKILTADGQQLARYLRNRGRPTDRTWRKYRESKKTVVEGESSPKTDSPAEDTESYNESVEQSMLGEEMDKDTVLRRDDKREPKRPPKQSYTMLRYGKKESAAFVASRFPACFGAAKRVFSEIEKRDPDFQPRTLLDFGSGAGTAIWAANNIWGNSLREYQCVDISDEANKTCEFLLRGGDEPTRPLKIPGVYFRKFLPLSNKVTYDVVVAAYSLSEMPFPKQRQAVISSLWGKTNDFLIIIEPGNNEGFDIALQARNYVTKGGGNMAEVASDELKMSDELPQGNANGDDFFSFEEEVDPGFVYAPCPHDVACPRSEVDSRSHPCNFEQKVELSFSQRNTALKRWSYVRERFSYLVLRKGERNEAEAALSRVLNPPKHKKRHVLCDLCRGNGSIERHVLTKKKDPELYKGVRHCLKWGDLMPEIDSRKKPVKVIRLDSLDHDE